MIYDDTSGPLVCLSFLSDKTIYINNFRHSNLLSKFDKTCPLCLTLLNKYVSGESSIHLKKLFLLVLIIVVINIISSLNPLHPLKLLPST